MGIMLSEHFSLEEMTYTLTGLDNTPSEFVLHNLKTLAYLLESVRTLINKPIKVTSGYRSEAVNKAVGGSKTSAHSKGYAADIKVVGLNARQVAEMIATSSIRFDQLILEDVSPNNPNGVWVHIGLNDVLRGQVLTMKSGKYYQGLIK